VRSFARDLWTVLPSTERFNRGGQGLSEIAARVRQTGAHAALIISMWKGNPSILSFTSSTEEELASIKMEMAMLRREVSAAKNRINGIAGVFVESNSSDKTRALGEMLASLLDIELVEVSQLDTTLQEPSQSLIWLQDISSGKILWTHYHTTDGTEIGPRIRVTSLRRGENDEF
jgi:rRNA maturation protein Rpf1